MQLGSLDWTIVGIVLLISVTISLIVGVKSSKNTEEFFLSGRSMPFWLLGASMVATTFSTDTPNLVADITRSRGISGNWAWWAFLLTGISTAFFFAKFWRRSGISTDIEFYELRYSGKTAAFLRAFRAIYLGIVFNILTMAAATLAAIKFGTVLLGISPFEVVIVAGTTTLVFSVIGGLRGVVVTDMLLFGLAMAGAIAAAYFSVNLPEVGGLDALFEHHIVEQHTDLLPNLSDPNAYIPLFIVPLLVQWWSVWYPGSEPGGGGYVAQRMLAAKNENHAMGAVLLFNFAHYALRPWPWILVALASLVVFPDLDAIRAAFPSVDDAIVGNDLAYPAMLTFLPTGWLGIVVASLLAAYMSTVSTSLNLGSSYLINDVYLRFIEPNASQKKLVFLGRIIMVFLMTMVGFFSLQLESALQAFNILLSVGAGTGLLFMLRWYWDRINAWSEISAMIFSFGISVYLQTNNSLGLAEWEKLLLAVTLTTAGWIFVTLLTPRTEKAALVKFYNVIRPQGVGWRWTRAQKGVEIVSDSKGHFLLGALIATVTACIGIYGLLFGIGFLLQSMLAAAAIAALVSGLGMATCLVCYRKYIH